MIKRIHQGDIFESECQILVNPCNAVGVMGGGLALQFRKRYPSVYKSYVDYCKAGKLQPGGIHVCMIMDRIAGKTGMRTIVNLATKDDWRECSQFKWVENGLRELFDYMTSSNITTVAIPALGCGLGGLDWRTVYQAIKNQFEHSPFVVEVYEPF